VQAAAVAPSASLGATSSTSTELEQFKAKQEKLVQAVIKKNEDSELSAMRRTEENMEELRRDNQKRVEKLTRENKERVERQILADEEFVKRLKQKNGESLARLLSDSEAQLAEMLAKQEKEKAIQLAIQLERAASKNQPAAPECPVCLDQMVPPTRILQCTNGHLTCETCKSKMRNPLCPECRKAFIGRAFGMENFLQDLFKKASSSSQ